MGCVHDWSPTSLTYPCPETGYELKKRFAETHLHGEVKAKFLEELQPTESETRNSQLSSTTLQDKLLDMDDDSDMSEDENQLQYSFEIQFVNGDESTLNQKDDLEKLVRAQLNDSEQEYFRWLFGLRDEGPAQFSRKWAQRWVCKRAYEFGWTEERFSRFDGSHQVRDGRYRGKQEIERIGKKYQWLAFHELLARFNR